MLMKITKAEEVEVDVPLPAYFEYGSGMQCILGERESIEVQYYGFEYSIRHITDSGVSSIYMREGRAITGDQFSAKLAEIKQMINKLT